jgi:hypothetical protein
MADRTVFYTTLDFSKKSVAQLSKTLAYFDEAFPNVQCKFIPRSSRLDIEVLPMSDTSEGPHGMSGFVQGWLMHRTLVHVEDFLLSDVDVDIRPVWGQREVKPDGTTVKDYPERVNT